jgi:hypothetical protein
VSYLFDGRLNFSAMLLDELDMSATDDESTGNTSSAVKE